MSLKNWSTTASSNNSAAPNGAPEGMTMASVNDTIRQIMADVRTIYAQDTIASATTTDIGTKDAASLTVTGTTTITGLGTVSAGIKKNLKFDGALTFTHNATSLILPGGANITTAAGDTCEVESLGSGNWRCNWYQRANGEPIVQGTVAIAKGGTGQTTATAAFDALAPTTTQGDMIYHNGTDNVRLPKGTASQQLRINSGETAPEWFTPASVEEKSKVSSNDTTAGYLNGKLVAGSNITLTENNNGANETLTIAASGGVPTDVGRGGVGVILLGYITGIADQTIATNGTISGAYIVDVGSTDGGANFQTMGSAHSGTFKNISSSTAYSTNNNPITPAAWICLWQRIS